MRGIAKMRQIKTVNAPVDMYGTGGIIGSMIAATVVPLAVTVGGNYLLSKVAYPRDMTTTRWLMVYGGTLALGLAGSLIVKKLL